MRNLIYLIEREDLDSDIVFLKLGGSLITDKNRPHTHRPEVLRRLAGEIAEVWSASLGLRLVLGHGSGSFGHVPARRWRTREGVRGREAWEGFIAVWRQAVALNRLVMDALATAGLPALAFPPSASVIAKDGAVDSWDLAALESALSAGLLPVIYGDVVFDRQRGGTILSTEDLFGTLALRMRPVRILLAGLELGVWADYPACTRLIDEITPANFPEMEAGLNGSAAVDVTGGMASKVSQSLALAQAVPGLEVMIFSGERPGSVREALLGARIGTVIRGP